MAQNNIFGEILQSVAPQQNIRDYQHAARTFVDGLYRLSPKFNNLFHVFIDMNQNIAGVDQLSQIETGLMAKSVQLPKFNITSKVHNAYNRKTVQQERVSYDPVNISFHDDSADVVRKFWQGYFSYYYRDSDYQIENYGDDSKYKPRTQQNWGYSPVRDNPSNIPYISSIRIYSLHQKRFSSYTLIRPMISNFTHGQHIAGEYVPMEHTMTINYEAVLYDSGPVSEGTVMGFDQIHYDNTSSPLRNLGALISGADSILKNIDNGDFGSAVQNVLNEVNVLTGSNRQVKQTPDVDLSSIGENIMKGRNPLSSIFVPTSSTVQNGISKAESSSTGSTNQGIASLF